MQIAVHPTYNVPMLHTEGTSMSKDPWSSHYNAIVDGQSQVIQNASPFLARYNGDFAQKLFWRVTLFRDELALWMLQQNTSLFFD